MYTSTVTQKGQVTIPIEFRKKLGLKKGSKVEFTQKNGEFLMRRPDFISLRGSLKSTKKYNKKAARKAIGKYLAKKHGLTK